MAINNTIISYIKSTLAGVMYMYSRLCILILAQLYHVYIIT